MEGSKEIYRVAFETANADLTAINAEFERLRARKEQVEKLVAVLLVLFGEEQNAAASQVARSEPAQAVAVDEADSNAEPQPVPSDPFQRRIDHVLGIGAGIRDVRKYTRQF